MRPFLNSPKNGLFAGGIIFALGLHLGGEKCDLKKCPISRPGLYKVKRAKLKLS